MQAVSLGRANLRVDHRIVGAVQALNEVLVKRHGYDVHPTYPTGDTGSYNCRHIGNDSSRPWSSHAWATAIDVNWNQNPDGSRLRTNIPRAAIDDIHRISTKNGAPVWRWGGDWDRDPRTDHSYYDAMHFEIHATPQELSTGIIVHGTSQQGGDGEMPTAEEIWAHRIPNFVTEADDDHEAWRILAWAHFDANTALGVTRDLAKMLAAVSKQLKEHTNQPATVEGVDVEEFAEAVVRKVGERLA